MLKKNSDTRQKLLCIFGITLLSLSVFVSYARPQGDSSVKRSFPYMDFSQPLFPSVVVPPQTPQVLTGIGNGFSTLGLYCNSSKQVALGWSDGTINWFSGTSSINLSNYNTLTVTFSSLPPGPAHFRFYSGTTSSANIPIDNTTVVLDKTTYLSFFPSGSFTGVQLVQDNSWTTGDASSCPKANAGPGDWPLDKPYPGLQWEPNTVLFIYQ